MTIYNAENPQIIQWALKDNLCYVYNQSTKRVIQFADSHYDALNNAIERLDSDILLPGFSPKTVTINEVTWQVTNQTDWYEKGKPNSPPASIQVAAIMNALFRLKLKDFDGVLVNGQSILRVSYEIPQHRQSGSDEDVIHIEVRKRQDGTGLISSSFYNQPAQELTAAQVAEFEELVADIEHPRIFSLFGDEASSPINNITIYKGGILSITVNRPKEFDNVDGSSGWSVAWEGGLEAARSDIGLTYLQALNDIRVENIQRREKTLINPPQSDATDNVTITFDGAIQFSDGSIWVRVSGNRIENSRYTADIVEADPLIQKPEAELILTRQLLSVSPDRVSKVQRIDRRNDWSGEVLNRTNGLWSRQRFEDNETKPVGLTPQRTDYLAVQQLVRTAIGAKAVSIEAFGPKFQSILDAPTLSWAARIESVGNDVGNDYDQLEETSAREWGLSLGQVDGKWWGIDSNGAVAFELEDDLVTELFTPIIDKLVFPLVSTQVSAFVLRYPDGEIANFRKALDDGQWYYDPAGDDEPVEADNEQVRAYLLRLSALAATHIEEEEAPLTHTDAIAGSVQCKMPGFDDIAELLTLTIGQVDANNELATSVTSSRQGANMTKGRSYIDAQLIDQILPPVSSFLPADSILLQPTE